MRVLTNLQHQYRGLRIHLRDHPVQLVFGQAVEVLHEVRLRLSVQVVETVQLNSIQVSSPRDLTLILCDVLDFVFEISWQ